MANTESQIRTVKPKRVPRVDGALKVTGTAEYTADFKVDRLAHAVPVGATIAKGTIRSIDDSAARNMKGVLAVYTRKNIGPIFRVAPDDGFQSRIEEARPPFEDDVIRYYGQYVAVVVAETFEIAQNAARSIKVAYNAEKPNMEENLQQETVKKTDTQRGDAAGAFKTADVKIDRTYGTPTEFHNPIEMHATIAQWGQDSNGMPNLLIYESSQAMFPHRNVMAQMFGIPQDNVRVITKFVGSGFGGKLWAWPHSALAAATARNLKRPVKIVLERRQMFTNVGYRPRTQQTVKLGADRNGKLVSLQHHYASQTSMEGDYRENCGEVSGLLYKCDNVKVTSGLTRRNMGVPTSMRGPGAVPGLYALESAMDELATELKMDPVKLRLMNDTLVDGSNGQPFTSRHLKECLELGAQKFGWSKRKPEVGSMRDGDEILGWGVSAATWPAKRLDAEATIEFMQNGMVKIASSTQDIGTGTYTVLAELASEETELPLNRIEVALGDTQGPQGPLSGGSMATASLVPAVVDAAKAAIGKLLNVATKMPSSPFYQQDAKDLTYAKGKVSSKKGGSVEFGALIKKLNVVSISGKGSSKGNFAEKNKPTGQSFGAQFIELGWRPEIGRLRVRRVVTVMDAGRIINFQPARNQIEGAIVMGLGMGLMEYGDYDKRFGHPANANLADYVVPVHADMPDIDVTFLDYPDKEVNSYGARGVGEIGLAGVASAITSAVYHATGVRVRSLPVRIEDLLQEKAEEPVSPIAWNEE